MSQNNSYSNVINPGATSNFLRNLGAATFAAAVATAEQQQQQAAAACPVCCVDARR